MCHGLQSHVSPILTADPSGILSSVAPLPSLSLSAIAAVLPILSGIPARERRTSSLVCTTAKQALRYGQETPPTSFKARGEVTVEEGLRRLQRQWLLALQLQSKLYFLDFRCGSTSPLAGRL